MSQGSPQNESGDVFVGRSAESGMLRDAMASACAGRGRLIFLTGPPGIGKTRLAEKFASIAMAAHLPVLWGRCFEGDGAPSFWPWVQILRGLVQAGGVTKAQKLLGNAAPDVARLHATLEPLAATPRNTLANEGQERFRLFDGITRWLRESAAPTGMVVVLDDLHGADASSLQLLRFVVREIRSLHIVLVGTYREEALRSEHLFSETMAEALRDPSMQTMTLGGWSELEVENYLAQTLGDRLSVGLVRAVHTRTEGHPLFVSEYVRMLRAEPSQQDQAFPRHDAIELPLPLSVRALISLRLKPLSAACRAIVEAAAVYGRDFPLAVVEQAAVEAADERDVKGIALLDAALGAGLVVPLLTRQGWYRFSHALIRETLYDDIAPARRRRLHRLVGEAIIRSPEAAEHLAEIAHHLAAAGSDGERLQAVRYAVMAGDLALRQFAHEEAGRCFRLALDGLSLAAPGTGAQALDLPMYQRRRADILLRAGDAAKQGGDVRSAMTMFEEVRAIARDIGAPETFARAAIACKLNDSSANGDPQLIAVLEEALDRLPAADSSLRVRVLACLANERARVPGERSFGADLSRTALAMARRLGDTQSLTTAWRHWYEAAWSPDTLEERTAVANEALALAARLQNSEIELEGLRMRIAIWLEIGAMAAADRDINAFAAAADAVRQLQWMWWVPIFRGTRALMEGRFADAEAFAKQAITLGRRAQQPDALPNALSQILTLRLLSGDLDPGEIDASVSIHAATRSWNRGWDAASCYIYTEMGRLEQGRVEFDKLAAEDFVDLPRDAGWLVAVTSLARAASALEDEKRAALLYDLLLPYASRPTVTNPSATQCYGAVGESLGLLASLLERWDEAVQHFEVALAANQRIGAPPFVAMTQFSYAQTLVRRRGDGDLHQAKELATRASEQARAFGMKPLAERSACLSQQLGLNLKRTPVPMRREAAEFRFDGDVWHLGYAGAACELNDTKGLRYIARLLARPGESLHVLDLVADTEAVGRNGEPARVLELAVAALDETAKRAYKRRLVDLREALAEAEANNEADRASQIQAEIRALAEQLSAAVGLDGRDRPTGTAGERARSAVTKRVKDAMTRIERANPSLAHYLRTTIRTGLFCVYVPDPQQVVSWLF